MDYPKKCKFALFLDVFFHVNIPQTHTLVEKQKKAEENSFSESDDARFRHPSNDKKKKKNWCRHQPQENERGSRSVIRCYLCLAEKAW